MTSLVIVVSYHRYKILMVTTFYFTTKRLHEQYRVSSGQYRWIYCPLVPEGSIKFSVMPAGKKNEKKCFFSLNLTDFNKLFFQIDQKIEPKSILRV